jgi:hypothetical protein
MGKLIFSQIVETCTCDVDIPVRGTIDSGDHIDQGRFAPLRVCLPQIPG